MKTRTRKLNIESLENRSMLSTTPFPDFNQDGFLDKVEIASPTTIVVSLGNVDGSFTKSATLTAPKNQTFTYVEAADVDGDGDLDVYALSKGGSTYISKWLSNGDGTFGTRTTEKWTSPFKMHPHAFF